MNGIALTKRLHYSCQSLSELIVCIDVCRIFLYWIINFKDSRVFAFLGIEYTNSIIVFYRIIDILEDMLAFTSSTECIHRNCHSYAESCEYEYDI